MNMYILFGINIIIIIGKGLKYVKIEVLLLLYIKMYY